MVYSGASGGNFINFALYNNDDSTYVHDFGGMTLYPADNPSAYGSQIGCWEFTPVLLTVTTETDFKVKGKTGSSSVLNGVASTNPMESEFGYSSGEWSRNDLVIEKLK